METKIELERILAKLTGSQRTLVKGWYRKAQMFADLVDNKVVSGEIEYPSGKYTCVRVANINGKIVEYNYKVFKLYPLVQVANNFETRRVDPLLYLNDFVRILERKESYAKK